MIEDQVAQYAALGATFSFASDRVDVLELVDRLYVHCQTIGNDSHAFAIITDAQGFALDVDGGFVLRNAPPGLVLDRFAWEVNRLAWDSHGHDLLTHAGVIAIDGRAAVLCAGSGRGKSTLTLGLVERGAAYLSDEIAAIDVGDMTVHAFPRPIALRPNSWPLVRSIAPALGPTLADFMVDTWFVVPPKSVRSASLAVVLFPTYVEGVYTRIEPIGEDEARAVLCDQTPRLGDNSADGLVAVRRLIDTTPCARLVFSDLDAAAALVAEQIAVS